MKNKKVNKISYHKIIEDLSQDIGITKEETKG